MMGFRCIPMDTRAQSGFGRLAVMTPVIFCTVRLPITPRLANIASQKPRSAHPCCSVPAISGGHMVCIGHQIRLFLHAEPCERFKQADIVLEIVRHRLVSERA